MLKLCDRTISLTFSKSVATLIGVSQNCVSPDVYSHSHKAEVTEGKCILPTNFWKKAAIFQLRPCLYFCFQLNLNKKQQIFWEGIFLEERAGTLPKFDRKKAIIFW